MGWGRTLNNLTGATDSAKQQLRNQMALQHDAQAYSTWQMQNAHQIEVADLEKAGINPVMTAGGTGAGASVTEGSAQAGHAQGDILGALLGAITTAKGVEKTDAEIKNINADTENKKITNTNLPELNQSIIDLNNAQTAKAKQEKQNLVANEVFQNVRNEILNIEKDVNYSKYSIQKRKEIVHKKVQNQMKALEIQAKKLGMNDKDWKIAYDSAMEMIDSFVSSWSPLTNALNGGGNTYNFSQSVPTVNYAN